MGCEARIYYVSEVIVKQIVDQNTDLLRYKVSLIFIRISSTLNN
jgi:hypothetical protein